MDQDEFEKALVEAIRLAVTRVTSGTQEALEEAVGRENKEGPQVQLKAILENIEVGKDESRPICQDTGTPTFFVEVGADFEHTSIIKETIIDAVRTATEEIPLRPNAVHTIEHKNSGDNTGRFIPAIHWEVVDGDEAVVHVMPKGGGSENMSKLVMMTPGKGLKGVKEIVLEHVAAMEGKACAPTIIGIGLGGGSDMALELAKKALLRPVGERHEEKKVADMEEELLDKINQLGVGPMGVGGETTVLDVKIEHAHRHPASFPVAVVPQCWANRQAEVKISSDGKVEVIE
ncbi:MAG: fumarate hydratase [Candidatus Saliniplasma sp.]